MHSEPAASRRDYRQGCGGAIKATKITSYKRLECRKGKSVNELALWLDGGGVHTLCIETLIGLERKERKRSEKFQDSRLIGGDHDQVSPNQLEWRAAWKPLELGNYGRSPPTKGIAATVKTNRNAVGKAVNRRSPQSKCNALPGLAKKNGSSKEKRKQSGPDTQGLERYLGKGKGLSKRTGRI